MLAREGDRERNIASFGALCADHSGPPFDHCVPIFVGFRRSPGRSGGQSGLLILSLSVASFVRLIMVFWLGYRR